MKTFSLFLGMLLSLVMVAVLLVIFGVKREAGAGAEGASLYDPMSETTLRGMIVEVQDYNCPISENEIGRHLLLETKQGTVRVHLAAARIMRSQGLEFRRGEEVEVLGSQIRLFDKPGLIAREMVRGRDAFVLRDHQGKMIMQQ